MIDGVQLMAYFDNFQEMTALFNNYKTVVGENKIAIGVKAPTTPLEEVKRLCLWNPNKAGMMMWTLNRDCEEQQTDHLQADVVVVPLDQYFRSNIDEVA